MKFRLHDFHLVRPRFEHPQDHYLNWLSEAFSFGSSDVPKASLRKLFDRYGCDASRIAFRGTDLPEFSEMPSAGQKTIALNGSSAERALFYQEITSQKVKELFASAQTAPSDIFHVTCTGYVSPGPCQTLTQEKSWQDQTTLTNLYHMGCYASIPAARLAKSVAANKSRVDIVHTEMCSLHMNNQLTDAEQMVIQSLFGDGYVKYSVQAEDRNPPGPGFEMMAEWETLIPGSEKLMSWKTGPTSMEMNLSRDVPQVIALNLQAILNRWHSEISFQELSSAEMLYAIHPGGPRIIDGLQDKLRLQSSQVRHGKQILKKFGNMSSATLPHIWNEILHDPEVKNGTLVMSLAFGPGLTVVGSLMRKLL